MSLAARRPLSAMPEPETLPEGPASRIRRFAPLAVGLAAYTLLVARAVAAHRDWINPDAVVYLRDALYWSQGRDDALLGYWSPMLPWCVAPSVAAGLAPLHAAYAVVAAWGALLVAAVFLTHAPHHADADMARVRGDAPRGRDHGEVGGDDLP